MRVWDEEPPPAQEPEDEVPPSRPRTEAVTVLVVALVTAATMCLCCLAARQALQLFDLDATWLF